MLTRYISVLINFPLDFFMNVEVNSYKCLNLVCQSVLLASGGTLVTSALCLRMMR